MNQIDELQSKRIALKIEINSYHGNSVVLENFWKKYHDIKQQLCDLKRLNDRRNKIQKICSKLEKR